MGFIDALVNRSFRETPAGRVVVFSGDPRKRGYLVVKSQQVIPVEAQFGQRGLTGQAHVRSVPVVAV